MHLFNQLEQANMVQAFNKAATHYESVALVQKEIGQRLFERLAYIKLTPATIVDLGCGTGYYTRKLAAHYPQAKLIGIDLAQHMIAMAKAKSPATISYQCKDAQQTTLASHSVDLIFSNLLLQWCDVQAVMTECKRLLKPKGLLLFTSLGPDTLYELRACWKKIDNAVHVNHFIDMHHLGDCLVKTQFVDPVMDSEYLTATFSELIDLMYSLKMVGAHNVNIGRNSGLMGKHKLQCLIQQYEAYRDAQGLLPLTYEVVYGHAWQPDFTVQQTIDEGGDVHVPVSILKKTLVSR